MILEQPWYDGSAEKFLAKGAFHQTFGIYDFATESPVVVMKTICDRPNKSISLYVP